MADGNAQLDAMIAKIRKAGRMVKDAAPTVAASVQAAMRAKLDAGQAPNGTPWAATKAGNSPLRGASAALTVVAVGSSILMRINGRYVFHHRGTAKVPKRQILPEGEVPPAMSKAINSGLAKWWKENVS